METLDKLRIDPDLVEFPRTSTPEQDVVGDAKWMAWMEVTNTNMRVAIERRAEEEGIAIVKKTA